VDRPGLALLWHGFSPPRSEEALAAALPLAGVLAWRVYLGLPLFGQRLVAGGVDEIMRRAGEDFLLDLFVPAVEGAVAALPRAELRATLKIDPQAPLGLFGFSAGGAARLALASGVLPVRTVAVYGPIVDPASSAEENARYAGGAYRWTDASRAAAHRLRLEDRADEIAGRDASLLIALGQDDWPALTEPALRLAGEIDARRALVESERRDDRLRRAPMRQQDQHNRHQPRPLMQPVVGCARRRGERHAAGLAAVAPLLLAVDADVARADPSLVRTGRIGTECSGRVHAMRAPLCGNKDSMPPGPVPVISPSIHGSVGLYRSGRWCITIQCAKIGNSSGGSAIMRPMHRPPVMRRR